MTTTRGGIYISNKPGAGGGGGGGDYSVYTLDLTQSEEPTQAQLAEIYSQKPDCLKVETEDATSSMMKTTDAEGRLYYFTASGSAGDITLLKIEYSQGDGYVFELYEFTLEDLGGAAKAYELQDYTLDLDEPMSFSCSTEDAQYIMQNNPIAISMDGVIAFLREVTDDEPKNDYSRGYAFFEYNGDDSIIIYEIGVYYDGSDYDFDIKASDPIGGSSGGTGDVTGPNSSTTDHIATFDGSTGKAIKDSGYTIATSVPANAVFTDTLPSITTSGSGSFVSSVTTDGTGALTVTYGTPSAGGDVNGPSSSTSDHVATFDGSTGKTIKDSGYTIGSSVPANAVFTDTLPSITTSGNGNVVTDIAINGSVITQTKDVLVQMDVWHIVFTDNSTMDIPVCYATAASN